MTGWNLPPGCTPAMIDEAMGGNEPRCDACGEESDALEVCLYRGRRLRLCDKAKCWPPEDNEP